MPNAIKAVLATLLFIVAAATSESAHAEDQSAPALDATASSKAAAAALFDEAMTLMQARDFAGAVVKLERARANFPGKGILFNLARCYERLGRTASAWATYREAASKARLLGEQAYEVDALEHAAHVEKRLTKLRVVIENPPSGTSVTRNGEPVDEANWNDAVPLDPGTYHIAISAPNHQRWTIVVNVTGDGATVRVVVPTLALNNNADGAVPQIPDAAEARASSAQDVPDTAASETWQAPLGIAMLALGGGGLLAGGVLAAVAKSTHDSAACDAENACTAAGMTQREQAVALGDAATGTLIAGGLISAAGLTTWLLIPNADQPAISFMLTPNRIVVQGSF